MWEGDGYFVKEGFFFQENPNQIVNQFHSG